MYCLEAIARVCLWPWANLGNTTRLLPHLKWLSTKTGHTSTLGTASPARFLCCLQVHTTVHLMPRTAGGPSKRLDLPVALQVPEVRVAAVEQRRRQPQRLVHPCPRGRRHLRAQRCTQAIKGLLTTEQLMHRSVSKGPSFTARALQGEKQAKGTRHIWPLMCIHKDARTEGYCVCACLRVTSSTYLLLSTENRQPHSVYCFNRARIPDRYDPVRWARLVLQGGEQDDGERGGVLERIEQLRARAGIAVHAQALRQAPRVWQCQPQRQDPAAAPAHLHAVRRHLQPYPRPRGMGPMSEGQLAHSKSVSAKTGCPSPSNSCGDLEENVPCFMLCDYSTPARGPAAP